MFILRALRSLCLVVPVAALAVGCIASNEATPPPEATASNEEALDLILQLPGPTRPYNFQVQTYPTMVSVKWKSADESASAFDVQRRDINGNWQVVHTETNTPLKEYTWVDTDRSLSAQCYLVSARNLAGYATSTAESCTVRPDGNVFPQTAPSFVAQWSGLSRTNDGVGVLRWQPENLYLQTGYQEYGVNLALGSYTGSPNVRVQRRMPGSTWPLMNGELVAVRVWGAGWLSYFPQDWGINITVSSTPSYEWRVIAGTIGQPLTTGGFALYNAKEKDFLVKAERSWGVRLKWYENTLPTDSGGGGGTSTSGVSKLTVYNCISERRPLEMWVADVTAGTGWVDSGRLEQQYNSFGSCPTTGSPWTFTPISGHQYIVEAIDFSAPGCSNDPRIGSCARQTTTFVGNAAGQPVVLTDG
jgi:hypothetical protein